MTSSSALVIGLGNALRGDDAAGLAVARRVRARAPALRVLELQREPSELLDVWADADPVLVIDAVAGSQPGRIHRIDPIGDAWIARAPSSGSSHGLGLGEVIELARVLGRMPRRLIVFAVEGASFELGSGPSPRVAARLDELADSVIAETRA